MKTLEEKARIARERVFDDLKQAYNIHKDIQHYATATACIEKYAVDLYNQGATDALAGKWISVEDKLPEENTMVLCRMKSNGAIVSGYISKQFSDYPMVSTDPSFHFEDWGENEYECTHWMPFVELKEDEE